MLNTLYCWFRGVKEAPVDTDYISQQPADVYRAIFSKLSARDTNNLCITSRHFNKCINLSNVDISIVRDFYNKMSAVPSIMCVTAKNVSRHVHVLGHIRQDLKVKIFPRDAAFSHINGEAENAQKLIQFNFEIHRNLCDITETKPPMKSIFSKYYQVTGVSLAYVAETLTPRVRRSLDAGLEELNVAYEARAK